MSVSQKYNAEQTKSKLAPPRVVVKMDLEKRMGLAFLLSAMGHLSLSQSTNVSAKIITQDRTEFVPPWFVVITKNQDLNSVNARAATFRKEADVSFRVVGQIAFGAVIGVFITLAIDA